ncbi:gram-negative bacteria-binding protein 1-like isoform X2 [Condylostylus longicornis]|uniref:gram-negative bacteria-binding protein 1-like isoform X2 n=1 Tax=Condylostylus longicornis TaxID=2530218 RepID=UPI00244DA717|nr:gram-negative bacteria-binding protein 1-like isoform X2 [Condylostylus longicornis]
MAYIFLKNLIISFIICTLLVIKNGRTYTVPAPIIEILRPKGFRISIPDEPGITFCAFHFKIRSNEYTSMTTVGVNDESWIFENRLEVIDLGQGIIYKIDVMYNNNLYSIERYIQIPFSLNKNFTYLRSDDEKIDMRRSGFRISYPVNPDLTFLELTGLIYNDFNLDYIFNIPIISGKISNETIVYEIKTPKNKYYSLCFYTLHYWIRVFYKDFEYRIHNSVHYFCVNKILTLEPKVEILMPRGFRVLIPDEGGKFIFGLRGVIHKGYKRIEPVEFTLVSNKEKVVFENLRQLISPGSTLTYTIFVEYNKSSIYEQGSLFLSYETNTTEMFLKNDFERIFINKNYTAPIPILESVTSRGFKLYFADDLGMRSINFRGKINQNIKKHTKADFHFTITRNESVDGRWSYEYSKKTLNPGDRLYYHLKITYDNPNPITFRNSIFIPFKTGNKKYILPIKTINTTTHASLSSRLETIYESAKNEINISEITSEEENCVMSVTTVNGRQVCSRQLIFEEKFDKLVWKKWQRVIQIGSDSGDAEFVSFQDYPENSFVSRGYLHIIPKLLMFIGDYIYETIRTGLLDFKENCTSNVNDGTTCKRQARFSTILPPVVSAKFNTKHFFSFRYGKVEIRAKVPKGDWLFSELLLQPTDNYYGIENYASGQLRMAFVRGNTALIDANGTDISGQKVYGGAVLAVGELLREMWLKNTTIDEHFGNRFHNFTLMWKEDSITTMVDGDVYSELYQQHFENLYERYNLKYAKTWGSNTNMAPFDKEFYIELGLSAGGMSDFPDECYSGVFRDKLKPWKNFDPKAELNFFTKIDDWYDSWRYQKPEMLIDHVKVWSL